MALVAWLVFIFVLIFLSLILKDGMDMLADLLYRYGKDEAVIEHPRTRKFFLV